ncbi:hypothetical protein CCH79_00006625 [Gambusia affinis]|uniref:AXH domain-containing protein n=1 Tax=Gambusia affinis TaxID=33528 RepID=A0A315W6Y9_GAMAF|nr:hypothetical protein CCH79_00006625 [Gambusia affinis]
MNPSPDRSKERLPPKKRESRQGSAEHHVPLDEFKPPVPFRSRHSASRGEGGREHSDRDRVFSNPNPHLLNSPPALSTPASGLHVPLPWSLNYSSPVSLPLFPSQVSDRRSSVSPAWRDDPLTSTPPHHSRKQISPGRPAPLHSPLVHIPLDQTQGLAEVDFWTMWGLHHLRPNITPLDQSPIPALTPRPILSPAPQYHFHTVCIGSQTSSPALHPSPPALLPHFTKGSLIELASGRLKRVEELRTEDFLRSADTSPEFHLSTCTVLVISPSSTQGFSHLQVHLTDRNSQELLQVLVEYPFFVQDLGWSSCSPQRTTQLYGLPCRQLSEGDVCLALTPMPTQTQRTPSRASSRAHRTQLLPRGPADSSSSQREEMPPPPPPPPLPSQPPLLTPGPSCKQSTDTPAKEQQRPRKRRWSAPDTLLSTRTDKSLLDLPHGSKLMNRCFHTGLGRQACWAKGPLQYTLPWQKRLINTPSGATHSSTPLSRKKNIALRSNLGLVAPQRTADVFRHKSLCCLTSKRETWPQPLCNARCQLQTEVSAGVQHPVVTEPQRAIRSALHLVLMSWGLYTCCTPSPLPRHSYCHIPAFQFILRHQEAPSLTFVPLKSQQDIPRSLSSLSHDFIKESKCAVLDVVLGTFVTCSAIEGVWQSLDERKRQAVELLVPISGCALAYICPLSFTAWYPSSEECRGVLDTAVL